ncbi:hypothetical protein [Exilibacterium tricleocarpae]|uniref:hypothetical protein n=1 Tax=Exilibacterium tricleocarpae TaxID=2591008 RepID=UPI0015D46739|nr:hypothetical protein [Exilibacterium tricleocarpae]
MNYVCKLAAVAVGSLPCLEAAGETSLDYGLRLRSANIDVVKNSAESLSAKVRLTLSHEFTEQSSALLQVDHIETFLDNRHSTALLANDNPLVLDTPATEINQLLLSHQWDEYGLTLGRQVIEFDAERFVGDIDFWQNDRTFDGISLNAALWSGSRLAYAYVYNVNRIFGDDAGSRLDPQDIRFDELDGRRPAGQWGDHRVDGHFLHLKVKEWDYVELSGYGFAVHNYDQVANSNRTLGLRSKFRYKPELLQYTGIVELARQQKQTSDVTAWIPYYLLEAGFEYRGLELNLRREYLGQKSGEAFITPLGSRHEFQGWADLFNVTPVEGVDDRSIRLNWRQRPWQIDLRLHRFYTTKNTTAIGDEINLDLIYKPHRKHEVKIRFADYRPESGQTIAPDRTKGLFISYSYNL